MAVIRENIYIMASDKSKKFFLYLRDNREMTTTQLRPEAWWLCQSCMNDNAIA